MNKKSLLRFSLPLVITLAVGCGDKKTEPEEKKAQPEEAATKTPTEETKPAAKPVETKTADKPKPKSEKAKRLGGTNSAEVMCANDSLMLTKFSFEALAGGKFCDECKKFDEDACGLDWPSSDVMPCDAYDEMRNGIYAAYGHTFSKKKWQERFAKEKWYKPVAKVDELALPVVAQKNIRYLKQAAAKCRKDGLGKDL